MEVGGCGLKAATQCLPSLEMMVSKIGDSRKGEGAGKHRGQNAGELA